MRLLTIFTSIMFVLSCTTSEAPTSGGTFIPNFVKGRVINEDGTTASGTSYLKKIEVTNENNHTTEIDSCKLDKRGFYSFNNFDNAHYVVETKHNKKSVLVDKLNFNLTDTILPFDARWDTTSTLVGRVLNFSGGTVFIPGTNSSADVNALGEYVLEDIPQGDFNITFSNNDSTYFLPVSMDSKNDTVYIADVDVSATTTSNGSPYETTTTTHFVEPVVYVDTVPEWYEGKDFDDVEYEDKSGEVITIIEIVYDTITDTVTVVDTLNSVDTLTVNDTLNVLDTLIVKDTVLIEPKKVLLVSDTASTYIEGVWTDWFSFVGHDVKIVVDHEVTLADTANIKAIVFTSQSDGSDIDKDFAAMASTGPIPVVCVETTVANKLNFSSNRLMTGLVTSMMIEDSKHYITESADDTIVIFQTEGQLEHVTLSSPDVSLLATHNGDSSKAVLYLYDAGDRLEDTTLIAQSRKVGYHVVVPGKKALNSMGEKILLRSLVWVLGQD